MSHANSDHLISHAGCCFPPEVISDAMWLHFRFPLSLLMVEEMLAARAIDVTYKTVRRWALKFGQKTAKNIRHRPATFGDKRHLDEVVVNINRHHWWLWWAVDLHGAVLDVLVQSRRNRQAAEGLTRKLIRQHGLPGVMITDKLKSNTAAKADLGLQFEHSQHKGLKNRVKHSHQPTRVREKVMRRFKSACHLRRFVSVHDQVANTFQHCRYLRDAKAKRATHTQAMQNWGVMSCSPWIGHTAAS